MITFIHFQLLKFISTTSKIIQQKKLYNFITRHEIDKLKDTDNEKSS